MRIILASRSPRRRELLSELLSDFEIYTAEVDEALGEGVSPAEGVEVLSERKGFAVYYMLSDEDAVIISSDTLVELDGEALGKPRDSEDARRMLRALSGRAHSVHTGISVRIGERAVTGRATTLVYFKELSDREIDDYVATGSPLDKAGAYGIQDIGESFVDRIEGDFDTVVGLSKSLLCELMRAIIPKDELPFGD